MPGDYDLPTSDLDLDFHSVIRVVSCISARVGDNVVLERNCRVVGS